MKIVSWNVNGLRACLKKGFLNFVDGIDADIICVQEIKMCQSQMEYAIKGYHQIWNPAAKKGYSGTLVLSKSLPIRVFLGFHNIVEDEGRLISLEYGDFYLVNCYAPQSQRGLRRLEYRMTFDENLRNHVSGLHRDKPVILCGDFNVAHQRIDLRNPKENEGNAGFTVEEREKFDHLLKDGFIDTYRFLHPSTEGAYTWWSYRKGIRERNIGWRLDYILASDELKKDIVDNQIFADVLGSDHCPICLDIKFDNIMGGNR